MTRHIHILGIAGTFMGGVALLAQQMGFKVSGSDQNIYPPMSTVLAQAGIEFYEGYDAEHIAHDVDCVIIGNALSRGNAAVEWVLNNRMPYQSGPQWLAENILRDKHVLAVAGTHGKTTTSSILLWILECAGLQPGYLIGGVPTNFNKTAFNSNSNYFVIEADEYDTAFFDKRSKFMHYQPQTLILNNLEYDHADIFENLEAIKKQFQYLLRTVPQQGTLLLNAQDNNLIEVCNRGSWSQTINFASDDGWQANLINADGSEFEVLFQAQSKGVVEWSLLGMHNVHNALAAMAAAISIGVSFECCQSALKEFSGVKRRLELISDKDGVKVYDDFAHHPTAIKTTISGLRAKVGNERIIVILQLGSNSMEQGVHTCRLGDALAEADQVYLWNKNGTKVDLSVVKEELGKKLVILDSTRAIIEAVTLQQQGDHLIIMSNKDFEGIHKALISNQ